MLDKVKSSKNDRLKLQLGGKLVVESNYSEESKSCKLFKFSIGNKSAVVTRKDLFGLLFVFADEKEQEDLVTLKRTKVRPITRLLSMRLDNDMKKGEIVSATFTYHLPEELVEQLVQGNPKKYREGQALESLDKSVKELV